MGKVGLIIQGPLVSSGKTGQMLHMKGRDPERDYVVYDCRKNIQTVIDDFGYLFEHIVVSTWKNELRPDDFWKGAKVIASSDEALPKKNLKGTSLPDNRFRQMFSILVGIEYLETHSDVDMVVKMRTDQYMDLGRMRESIERYQALSRYTREVIFVPSIMRGPPGYGIRDFYFAGDIHTMKKFARSMFAYDSFEFHPNIHKELWLKYAYEAYRDRIGVPEYAYFAVPYLQAYCEEALSILRFMLSRVFWPLSFACYETTLFRGEPLDRAALENDPHFCLFQETGFESNLEDISPLLPRRCPRFLGIHWIRYAGFRRRILKKPLSGKEQVSLYCNIGAARVFRALDRTIYYGTHPELLPSLVSRLKQAATGHN